MLTHFAATHPNWSITLMAKKSKKTQTLTKLSVAIYPNFGLVQGEYKVWLEKGTNKFQLQGLPVQLDSDSVYVDSFDGPGEVELLGSSYRAANLNAANVQAKSVGGKVTLHHGSTIPAEQERIKGRLLNLTGNLPGATAVLEVEGETQIIPNVQSISVSELPDGLSATPSLAVSAKAEKKGWYVVRLLYKTRGLSWNADVKWVYDRASKTVLWDGSVKVSNASGAAYLDASLKVAAGDAGNQYSDGGFEMAALAAAAPQMAGGGMRSKNTRQVSVQNLGQVKVYGVPGLSNVLEGERQTLPFLTRAGVPVKREYRVRAVHQWHAMGNRHEHEVRGLFLLKNDEEHKLGLPLPASNVQVLHRDAETGELLPCGGGWLTDTAVGQDMKVDVGAEFDLKAVRIVKKTETRDGETKTVKEVTTKKVYHTRECVVELFNGSDEDAVFVLEEVVGEGVTFKGTHNLTEVAAGSYETRVTVPAGKTESVSFTVEQEEVLVVETEDAA